MKRRFFAIKAVFGRNRLFQKKKFKHPVEDIYEKFQGIEQSSGLMGLMGKVVNLCKFQRKLSCYNQLEIQEVDFKKTYILNIGVYLKKKKPKVQI